MQTAEDFGGLRVAAFESRRAEEMSRLIERQGGVPHVSPSMREVPLGSNAAAGDFARRIISGEIEIVIFLTGVGFKHLVEEASAHVDQQEFLQKLGQATLIARGPKPVAAMKEFGLSPDFRVHEPNTWRELLQVIDDHVPVSGRHVGVQEYGQPNPQLLDGLHARGAQVTSVAVYRWDLPEDTQALEANVRGIAAGERDVAVFTSAHQVVNTLAMAQRLNCVAEFRVACGKLVIASIGPTTSEMLREQGLHVDLEPEHPRMGNLVSAAAKSAGELVRKKQQGRGASAPAAARSGSTGNSPQPARANVGTSNVTRHPSLDGPFMKACRREPTDVTPIWLMRQAGRYLPEYREIRARGTFLELCKNPQLCAEVMIRTVERLGVDAAIIFSDLLPILEPMGLDLEYLAGEGPAIHNPVREAVDVDRVRELESMADLEFVVETVRQTRAGLPERIPVIGFAGAPFTLASYVIEGGSSRSYVLTKSLMYKDPGAWNELLGRLARSIAIYLNAQIEAGAQCVQLFDSWVGCLGPDDYRTFVMPHVQELISRVTQGVPVIHFGTGNPALLPLQAEAGGDVIGVDWRISLADGWNLVGDRAVQGNLDPASLLSGLDEIRHRAKAILNQAGGRPGHIFNLGHGVLPQTDPAAAIALVEMVHELSAR